MDNTISTSFKQLNSNLSSKVFLKESTSEATGIHVACMGERWLVAMSTNSPNYVVLRSRTSLTPK